MFSLLPNKTTLRLRVVLCCAALGAVVGVCLAFVAEQISEHFERVLINEEMSAEIGSQIALHGNDPDARLPRSAWKSLYIDRPGHPPTSPIALRTLPPGVHELDDDDNDSFAAVRETPIGRVTMVAGLPNSPARERRFSEELFAMILLGVVLGAWLGRMLAGSMLAPVLRLSHEVDSERPGAGLQQIEADHHVDEVGALARALLRYRARMQLAIEREVLFSADASHELRTPLSVLQGTLDLLREGQGPAAPGQRRIERMRRTAAEIGTLLDALLLIARSDEAQETRDVSVELGSALASVIAEFREELDAARITLGVRCADSARIHAPPELLRVALRLLFRSIASGAHGTQLRLDADEVAIVLTSTDEVAIATNAFLSAQAKSADAPHDDANARRSDETGGIGMLRRLCQRYGWMLEFAHNATQPALLSLRILPRDAATPGRTTK